MLKWIADLLTIAPKVHAAKPAPVLLPTRDELLRMLADAKAEAKDARFDADFWKADSAHQVGKQQDLKAEIRKLEANVDYLTKQAETLKADRDAAASRLGRKIDELAATLQKVGDERDAAAKKHDELMRSHVGAEDCLRRMHALTGEYFGVETQANQGGAT